MQPSSPTPSVRKDLVCSRLASNSLCGQGWPWSWDYRYALSFLVVMLSLVGIPRITMGWRMFLKFLFEWTTLSGAGVGSLWPPAFEAASVQLVCAELDGQGVLSHLAGSKRSVLLWGVRSHVLVLCCLWSVAFALNGVVMLCWMPWAQHPTILVSRDAGIRAGKLLPLC